MPRPKSHSGIASRLTQSLALPQPSLRSSTFTAPSRPCGVDGRMKGEDPEASVRLRDSWLSLTRLYGWLGSSWKMADSDALEPSIILISMPVWLQDSNPVHVASVEVAAHMPFLLGFVYSQFRGSSTRRPGIVATAQVLPPVVAAITHRGGSRVMMNPVGKDAGQDREHGTLDGRRWFSVTRSVFAQCMC